MKTGKKMKVEKNRERKKDIKARKKDLIKGKKEGKMKVPHLCYTKKMKTKRKKKKQERKMEDNTPLTRKTITDVKTNTDEEKK